MRVFFAGTPEPAALALQALIDSQHDVVGVLTRPDARAGRHRRSQPNPVAALARETGIATLAPVTPHEPGVLEAIRELQPDVAPVVAYGHLIGAPLLDLPLHGWINLHFSLLPAWRGAAPVQHALMAGDEVTGATTFRLDEGMDTGPMLGSLTETVRPDDTSGSLLQRLSGAGAHLLLASLDALESGLAELRPQPAYGVSLAPKLDTAAAAIRWDRPAFAVDRHIRGCTPAPGAWTTYRGERLNLEPVRLSSHGPASVAPGHIEASKREVWVGTATGAVLLTRVQPPGKQFMAAPDWARGSRPEVGEQFGAHR